MMIDPTFGANASFSPETTNRRGTNAAWTTHQYTRVFCLSGIKLIEQRPHGCRAAMVLCSNIKRIMTRNERHLDHRQPHESEAFSWRAI
jgi:hypothetical protein